MQIQPDNAIALLDAAAAELDCCTAKVPERARVLVGLCRQQHADATMLAQYAQHLPGCAGTPCTCGLDAILRVHQTLISIGG